MSSKTSHRRSVYARGRPRIIVGAGTGFLYRATVRKDGLVQADLLPLPVPPKAMERFFAANLPR